MKILKFKENLLEVAERCILKHLDFVHYLNKVDENGELHWFNLLDKERENSKDDFMLLNLSLDALFRDFYNEAAIGGRLTSRANNRIRKRLRPFLDAALERMGFVKIQCKSIILRRFKTLSLVKIPFTNTAIIEKFARIRLQKEVEKYKAALLNGNTLPDGRKLQCSIILPCTDGEQTFGIYASKNPLHPRFFGWLTNARKKERIAVLHALTGVDWIEVDINNAVPQGICRKLNCTRTLEKIKTNTFLSRDEQTRSEQKKELLPCTFTLTSRRVKAFLKHLAKEKLEQFFEDCPEEWERYTNYLWKLKNVHDLFSIEDVMRQFQMAHPYALNVHDACFLPAHRHEDIKELVKQLRREEIAFKVTLHTRTNNRDMTACY